MQIAPYPPFLLVPEPEVTPPVKGIAKDIRADIETFVTTSPLFQYVPDKSSVITRLTSTYALSTTEADLNCVHQVFNTHPIRVHDPLFKDPKFDELIVLAHLLEILTLPQLGTAFYWRSAIDHYGPDQLVVLPMEAYNPRDAFSLDRVLPSNLPMIWSLLPRLFRDMANAPASEQYILVARVPSFPLEDYTADPIPASWDTTLFTKTPSLDKTPTITEGIYGTDVAFLPYYRFPDGSYGRTLPPVTLVKEACSPNRHSIEARYTKRFSTDLLLRFGVSDSLRENGLTGTRDVSLKSSFAPLPDRADEAWAPGETFTSHDLLFHFVVVNHIPLVHQRLFIALSDSVKEKGFLSLASAFEDMAAPNYCDLQTDDQLSKAFLNAIAFLAYYSVYYSLNSKLARAHQMDDLEAIRTNKDALISIPDQALIDAIQIAFTSFLPILETLPPDTPFKRTMITLVQNNPAHTFVHNGEFKPCSA